MNPAEKAALAHGARLFDQGAYWEAHEAWEAGWLKAPPGERDLWQGLILLAAAYLKVETGPAKGALTLARRALAKLEAAGEAEEVPVGELRETLRELVAGLEEGRAPASLPPPPTLSHPAREGGLSVPEAPGCPYCGETVEVQVEEVGPAQEQYVEDCPVCCRPWQVTVRREGPEVAVTLERDDD